MPEALHPRASTPRELAMLMMEARWREVIDSDPLLAKLRAVLRAQDGYSDDVTAEWDWSRA